MRKLAWIVLFSALGLLISCGKATSNSSGDSSSLDPGGATYIVTFEATWSAETHPTNFPPNPHFSGLIGLTHNSKNKIWNRGDKASDGIENMAETGEKSPLAKEIDQIISVSGVGTVISGGGISLSPGRVATRFIINRSAPLVSLVSMVAPSPDWFTGVNSLSLMNSGQWVDRTVIELRVYDSGTDAGEIFTSDDENERRPKDISLLVTRSRDTDFTRRNHRSIGRFIFEKQ